MDREGMIAWIEAAPRDSYRFAITVADRHIGNISLDGVRGDVADLGIMLGAKDVWGKGYGLEAIERLSRFGFEDLRLRRITASSPNPAFNAIMRRLGWKHLETSKAAFKLEGEALDIERWATRPNSADP